MRLHELKNKYRTLIGVEILEIKKINEKVYILIQKNYQGGLFSNVGLEQNIRQNIDLYFPGRELVFLWLYPGSKDTKYIIAPGYIFHLSDVLMISRMSNNKVTTIYVHGKQRIYYQKREVMIKEDLQKIGGLEFAGFNIDFGVPDIVPIDVDRVFCLTPIPCIASINDGRVFFEYIFDKYTVGTLNKLTIKILNYGNKTID